MSHYVNICQYGYKHGQCRCIGPSETRKVECDNQMHALNPKAGYEAPADADLPTGLTFMDTAASIPKDVAEYVTGPFKASPMTKEIWETLLTGLHCFDNAYGDGFKIDKARNWLHEQYGDWEE